jgi:hypothetical protein
MSEKYEVAVRKGFIKKAMPCALLFSSKIDFLEGCLKYKFKLRSVRTAQPLIIVKKIRFS